MTQDLEQETKLEATGPQAEIVALLERAVAAYLKSVRAADVSAEVELQVPRNLDHGDWATNVAMKLAKALKKKPLEIAEGIVQHLETGDVIESPQAAPPGFINLRVAKGSGKQLIERILGEGEGYGRSNAFAGERVLVEFVSANPTGPLHIGHGRNAVVGDTLARIYDSAGFKVEREYYYNDAGVQMGLLGRSLMVRYRQACGQQVEFPADGYKGDYMKDIAAKLHAEIGDSKAASDDTQFFTDYAASKIMEMISADLATLGIRFDHYFSESSLHMSGKVELVLERLRREGRIYEQEGAWWLKTKEFGDEKDRVVRKSDGTTTYLAPDIAYHEDKFARGYTRLVNVLGADHHSYVVRLKAAVKSLGHDPETLHAVLIQMVGVKRGDVTVKLSTRAGEFDPLGDILKEMAPLNSVRAHIGPDVVRFFFLMRATDSQLVFDLDLAKQQSMDNPYFYIQYAHARCCSLLAKAEESGMPWKPSVPVEVDLLSAPEERAILFQLGRLPAVIVEAAKKDEPLPVVNYLKDLATAFHAYFSAGNKDAKLRCIQTDEPALTQARLTLIVALRQVVANGLRLLGLTPIDRL